MAAGSVIWSDVPLGSKQCCYARSRCEGKYPHSDLFRPLIELSCLAWHHEG